MWFDAKLVDAVVDLVGSVKEYLKNANKIEFVRVLLEGSQDAHDQIKDLKERLL